MTLCKDCAHYRYTGDTALSHGGPWPWPIHACTVGGETSRVHGNKPLVDCDVVRADDGGCGKNAVWFSPKPEPEPSIANPWWRRLLPI